MYGNDFYLTDTQCTQANVDWLWDALCTEEEVELVLDQTYQGRLCPFVDEIARFLLGSSWRSKTKAWAWLASHGFEEEVIALGRSMDDEEWLALYRSNAHCALPSATKKRVALLSRAELAHRERMLQRRTPEEEKEVDPNLLRWVSGELAARKARFEASFVS